MRSDQRGVHPCILQAPSKACRITVGNKTQVSISSFIGGRTGILGNRFRPIADAVDDLVLQTCVDQRGFPPCPSIPRIDAARNFAKSAACEQEHRPRYPPSTTNCAASRATFIGTQPSLNAGFEDANAGGSQITTSNCAPLPQLGHHIKGVHDGFRTCPEHHRGRALFRQIKRRCRAINRHGMIRTCRKCRQ